MFGLEGMLESMLPPGVTMKNITDQAQQIAVKMIETAQTVQRVEKLMLANNELLLAINAKLDQQQAATLLLPLKESNHVGSDPHGTSESSYSAAGSAAVVNCDGDSGSPGDATSGAGNDGSAALGTDAGN